MVATGAETRDFVNRFAAAWAARDSKALLALCHRHGLLHSPLTDRPIAGAGTILPPLLQL